MTRPSDNTVIGYAEDRQVPTLFWVGAYLMQRVFAGHEEGGWFVDVGELATDPDTYRQLMGFSAAFLTEEGADAHAERLRTYLPSINEGRRPLSSVLSNGVYDVLVIAAPTLPLSWPERLPAYA